ncbi:mannan endo-1,4-beta-mannosidase 1-like [Aristolochia californica]|uniref:mannan endo-1,4-beta-mannosidase 1-like n=1 Tax=Aristolochia californica TaxID=171875 RepID=UPI0035E12B51
MGAIAVFSILICSLVSHTGSPLSLDSQNEACSKVNFTICMNAEATLQNIRGTVLNRVNTYTGVAYMDDPTIFSWELINEPRCESDLSGKTFQYWVTEMAAYVKSIDRNHMLEIGLEGFYGLSDKQHNPNGYIFGTDFVTNNQMSEIDFTTIHAYADQWLQNLSDEEQLSFSRNWTNTHIQFSQKVLKKPLVLGEFGKSWKDKGYSTSKRDAVFTVFYDIVDAFVTRGGPLSGALFWQLLVQGMDNLRDGYEVVLAESPSTANIIFQQSKKLSAL